MISDVGSVPDLKTATNLNRKYSRHIYTFLPSTFRWLGGVVVRALDLWSALPDC